jgi:hypothetical protein
VNRTGSRCVLDGYPVVALRDRIGLVPFAIRHGGAQMVTSRPPARFVVRPGGAAFVLLNHYRCDRGDLRAATSVRIRVPGQAVTLTLRLTDPYRRPSYCGPGDPGSTLTVSPFEPSVRAALRR